jgi:hypothetical protein
MDRLQREAFMAAARVANGAEAEAPALSGAAAQNFMIQQGGE